MDFITVLLPIFLPLIEKCLTTEGEDRTKARLRKAGPLVQWRAYRALVKSGKPRQEARQLACDICCDLRDCDDEDISELIDEVRSTA